MEYVEGEEFTDLKGLKFESCEYIECRFSSLDLSNKSFCGVRFID